MWHLPGRVLFASVFVVMKEHVFAENGLRGAVQWGDKDCGHLADGKTVKNCAIRKHQCLAIYMQSPRTSTTNLLLTNGLC